MQAWIPVVSSSLYFRKSVFSFRIDSILKWKVYIKLKVSWLRAFLWSVSQTSRDRVNSRHVRTHKKNSGDAVRRYKAFSVPNQNPVFAWPFGNGPVRVGTQGHFRPCVKNFRRAFSSGPTDCPWVSEDAKSEEKWMFLQASLNVPGLFHLNRIATEEIMHCYFFNIFKTCWLKNVKQKQQK